jgi:hypothetical protein
VATKLRRLALKQGCVNDVVKPFLSVLALGVIAALTACSGYSEPATDVGITSARFNAKGSCQAGESINWWFNYRRSGGALQQTPRQTGTCGAAVNDFPLTADVGGLAPGAAYVYQFCGFGSAGPTSAVCNGPNGQNTTSDFQTRPPVGDDPFPGADQGAGCSATACGAAYTTQYYKYWGVNQGGAVAGGLRKNVANWLYIQDCGGWGNNDCAQRVYELNRYGDEFGGTLAHGGGQGWLGVDHYGNWRYGRPYCDVTFSAGNARTKCYQVFQ